MLCGPSGRPLLGAGAPVVPRDGPSFIAVPEIRDGVELVAQPHGGALKSGGMPASHPTKPTAVFTAVWRALPAVRHQLVPMLRIDPVWNPLRDHPRFQALLAKYEN